MENQFLCYVPNIVLVALEQHYKLCYFSYKSNLYMFPIHNSLCLKYFFKGTKRFKILQMAMNFVFTSITMSWLFWNDVETPILFILANYVFFLLKITKKRCYKICFERDKNFKILQMTMNFGVLSIKMFWLLWNNFITPILVIRATYVFLPMKISKKKVLKSTSSKG